MLKIKILPLILILLLTFTFVSYSTYWDVSTAVYTEKFKLVRNETDAPYGAAFSSDGSKMFIVGIDNKTVFQYTLNTPWDVDTANYANKSKDISAQGTPYDMVFSSDGSKMYTISSGDIVRQYALGTPWDADTIGYTKSYDPDNEENNPYSVTFSSDGSKMYILGDTNETVYQYTLGTEWDIGSASYASKSKLLTGENSLARALTFSSDGSKMYTADVTNDAVYQYTLGTPWDVGTANYASKSKYIGDEDGVVRALTFSVDGSKMYILGTGNDTIFQYSLEVVVEAAANIMFMFSNF